MVKSRNTARSAWPSSAVRPSQGLAQQRQRDPDAGTAHQDSTARACGRQRIAREQRELLNERVLEVIELPEYVAR
jgi:hypothetical protein